MIQQERNMILIIIKIWQKNLKHKEHIFLAIKDMAGLLKPEAAYRLISELKETVNIPIHLAYT